ncbi:MAG: ChuX/HutX family heme-like substrate-binding protein [Prosthecobacter sp.]
MKPSFWEVDVEGGSAHVQLDARWLRLLPALEKCGLLMACAPSGPVTAAVAARRLRFESVPDSSEWVCLESGIELCPANLGGVLAALEPLEGGQHTASLQFFDREGEGCLKLMLTNHSDVTAFETFVCRHAMPRHLAHFGPSGNACSLVSDAEPDAQAVRSLWNGLRRTLPTSIFPGVDGISRRRALAVAGPKYAWCVRENAVLQLLRAMTLADAPLGIGVRNDAVFMPAGMHLSHWADCGCGTTFFSSVVQLTLRHELNACECWATRFEVHGSEVLSVEVYDADGHFRAGLGLRPEAHPVQREQWNHWLREAAC